MFIASMVSSLFLLQFRTGPHLALQMNAEPTGETGQRLNTNSKILQTISLRNIVSHVIPHHPRTFDEHLHVIQVLICMKLAR